MAWIPEIISVHLVGGSADSKEDTLTALFRKGGERAKDRHHRRTGDFGGIQIEKKKGANQ